MHFAVSVGLAAGPPIGAVRKDRPQAGYLILRGCGTAHWAPGRVYLFWSGTSRWPRSRHCALPPSQGVSFPLAQVALRAAALVAEVVFAGIFRKKIWHELF